MRRRWPDVERVALLHRVGDLAALGGVGAWSSSRRRTAAPRSTRREFAIDTLKETRADLEAGALGGRLRLGGRAARDPSGGHAGRHRSAEWRFLLFAVVASTVGISIVLLRNRRPNSMEHSIDEFERGLRALAPDTPARRRRRSE